MLKYISFKVQILLGFFAVIGLMIVISASSLFNLSNTKRDLSEINNSLLPNALLVGQMARDIVLVQHYLTTVSATHSPAAYQDAEKSAQDFKQGLTQFRQHIAGNAVKLKDVDMLEANFDLFYQDGKRMASVYLSDGIEAGNTVMQDFDHEAYKLSSQMIKLRNAEVHAAKSHVNNITETTNQAANVLWAMSLAIMTLALAIALLLTRHLSKQIGIDPLYAKGIAKEIAAGDLSRSINLDAGDKDSLLHAIKNMQQKLLIRRTAEHKAAEEILRIKMALDNTSTGIMLADNERNIIYVNKSVINALSKIEAKIREQIPSFSVDALIGSKMDNFYRNPAHQAEVLAALTGTHSEDMELGGRTIMVVANPVIDQHNERIGTVTEWHDRTAEVAVEKEVSDMVVAATLGDFTRRFDLQGKDGFLRELGESLNQMLCNSEVGFNEVARVLEALSHGNLTETITNNYDGTFGQLKDNVNMTATTLKNIIHQIKEAADCINTGSREIASGNNDLSRRTEQQAASLQQTATSMKELTAIVRHNAENAKQTSLLAMGAADVANQGGMAVSRVVTTMTDIKNASQKIEAIISVIDDIAFQTNIIAFNAAVQAAQAGAHGQGFAVVASEVRNLAQRAAASAGEIKYLIEDSVKKIDDGSQLAVQAGHTMEEILGAIRSVSGMMSEITAASVEQSAGIAQINQAIGQMDSVTQQNAALVEQAAAAAESLEEQARNLTVAVSGFKIDHRLDNDSAHYVAEDAGVKVSEFHRPHYRREHKEHSAWDMKRTSIGHVPYPPEKSTAAPQLLAVANGDWEEF